jgi:para-aminobenzoate synthetase component 1
MRAPRRFSGDISVGRPPGLPASCAGRVRERERLEWHRGDPGDPATLAEDFLAAHGLPVRDLAAPGGEDDHDREAVCGATLLLSAAAGADFVGGPAGAASPAPAVPDLVLVVWEHTAPPAAAAGRPPVWRPAAPAGPQSAAEQRWRPAEQRWRLGRWRASWTPGRHAAAVVAVQRAIADGDVYQVTVVGHAAARYRGDPAAALDRVAALSGARYPGTLWGAGWGLSCASPETLVAVEGGRVETRPVKGTRPATARGRAELLTSPKERAEHVMIVDLERNDLARVARTGSVTVDELFAVRCWCDLWQAESRVSARLAAGVGLARLLRAVCPGGSVTGAPKRSALELIAALEPAGRGPSMGALGWVGRSGLDLGLTIRTVAVDACRVHIWAGGGITWASDPAAEVAEAAAKAAPLQAALASPCGAPAGSVSAYSTLPNTAARNSSTRSKPRSE